MQQPTCDAACALSHVHLFTQALTNPHIVPSTHARAQGTIVLKGMQRLATPMSTQWLMPGSALHAS